MNRLIFILLAFCAILGCGNEEKKVPEKEQPDEQLPPEITKYQSIALTKTASGAYTQEDGRINIELYGSNAIYGVCTPEVANKHFMAETYCQPDEKKLGYGLALVHEKDGKPDFANFTSISVIMENGVPVVRVMDRQDGQDNVLDNTSTISSGDLEKRYRLKLTGTQFSVPFTQTNGKVRIIRNNISGFFHFYMGVKKEVEGVVVEDWIELAQSKDWSRSNQYFFACPIAVTGNNDYSNISFTRASLESFDSSDVSDVGTGFKAIQRNYTWAGFKGDAIVVSFGEQTPSGEKDRKFVFWTQANYVPHWHMNNELIFCYEFVEVWSNTGIPGCFEPMSDRMLRYSKVEIIEDNRARKVIHWHYVLINPNYDFPAGGIEHPEVDEYYTIYPDATGVRNIIFRQKTDGGFKSTHELSEPMAIAGSSTIPADHFEAPALVIANLSGGRYDLHPSRNIDVNTVRNWTEQLYVTCLKNAPNAFCGFAYNPERPGTAPLPVTPEFSWHDTKYQMSHFPVDKQPYITDYDKSVATFPSQVSHSSLIGIEALDASDWNSAYQVDNTGRKYRQYISIIGIDETKSLDSEKAWMQAWLNPGTVTILDGYSINKGLSFTDKSLRIDCKGQNKCSFKLSPSQKIKNPVFVIENWTGNNTPAISLNDKVLTIDKDYLVDKVNNQLIIWLSFTGSEELKVSILE